MIIGYTLLVSSNVASWKNPQTKWLGKSSMNLWSMHERFPIAICDYGWGSFFLRIMSGLWFVWPQTGSLGTVDEVLSFDDWLGRFETSSGIVPVLLCQRSRRTGWAWAKCLSTGPKQSLKKPYWKSAKVTRDDGWIWSGTLEPNLFFLDLFHTLW